MLSANDDPLPDDVIVACAQHSILKHYIQYTVTCTTFGPTPQDLTSRSEVNDDVTHLLSVKS